MTHPFLESLAAGRVLADGAMGTMLYGAGVPFDRCFDELNVSQPDLVLDVHRRYVEAGAQVIETNTFGANRLRLAEHGLDDRVAEINRAGAALARQAVEASGREVFVAGSVGPLGRPLAPYGALTPQEARAIFREQVGALVEGGVDLLIFETFANLDELVQAVRAAREVSADIPVVAQATFNEDGRTQFSNAPAEVVAALEEAGADVIGANCSVGPLPMLDVVREMVGLTQKPVSAMPNAGFPTRQRSRVIYPASPSHVADVAREMAKAGVRLIGACCGTGPEHTQAIAQAIRDVPAAARAGARTAARVRPADPAAPSPRAPALTGLAAKLVRGEFAVTVEVDPPNGFDLGGLLPSILEMRQAGLVDAVNVSENPRAQARMSALAMCSLVQSRIGMETILHLATRHRNLVAIHSELLGAHALGVRNLFVVMGDLPRIGDYPNATAVADVTASGLLKLIKQRFNQGVGLSGKPLDQATSFFVGAALNVGSPDPEREYRIFQRKLEAGADFALTQPVFEIAVLEGWLERFGPFPVPVLLGCLPLVSHRHTEFLHNEVPGMHIPEPVRERMRRAGDGGGEAARQEGLQIARQVLGQAAGRVAGAYLMPPFGRYEMISSLLEGLAVRG